VLWGTALMPFPHAEPAPDLQPLVAPAVECTKGPIERARALLHGAQVVGGALQKVGAADVAHEDEVARDRSHRHIRHGAVRDEERQVLGCMARGVHRLQDHTADDNAIAVTKRTTFREELVLPFRVAFVREVQQGAGPSSQLPAPRQEIGVDVGFGDVGDAHALGGCAAQVHLHVPKRIDHDGLARGAAADEVAGLREAWLEETAYDHVRKSPAFAWRD
jgi:hypothetical protein